MTRIMVPTTDVTKGLIKNGSRMKLSMASSLGGIYGSKGLSELLIVCLDHNFVLFRFSVRRALRVYDILPFQNHHSIQNIERYPKRHLATFPSEISFYHSSKTIDIVQAITL